MYLQPFLLERTFGAESEMGVMWGEKGFNFDLKDADYDTFHPTQSESLILDKIVESDNTLFSGFLQNGGRMYLDGSHPEYATPECTSPKEAACYLHGTDLLFHSKVLSLRAKLPTLRIFRDNTDWHSSYHSTHENYLIFKPDEKGVDALNYALSAYLLSQGIWAGSGFIDPISGVVSCSTAAIFRPNACNLHTLKGIRTREMEETTYQRLQIKGEANGLQEISFLKFAITSLVLSMIEAGFSNWDEWVPDPEVGSVKLYFNRLDNKNAVRTLGFSRVSALDIQKRFAQSLELFLDFLSLTDHLLPVWAYPALDRFNAVLSQVETFLVTGSCKPPYLTDWMCKNYIFQDYIKMGYPLSPDSIRALCMAYHATDPADSLLEDLYADGRALRIFTYEDLFHTLKNPSRHPRAMARSASHGALLNKEYGCLDW